MKILVARPLSSISTDSAFGEGLKMGIPHLNDLCFLFLVFLGAVAHTMLTKLDDKEQGFIYFLKIFISFKVL